MKKKSYLLLFSKRNILLIIFFIIFLLGIAFFIGFLIKIMDLNKTIQVLSIPVAGFITYFIFLLNQFYNYKTKVSRKNSLILSLLTELEHNAQLIIDIRKHFVQIVAPILIKKIESDKKDILNAEERKKIINSLENIRLDKLKEKSNILGDAINKFEKIYLDEKDVIRKEKKVNYLVEIIPAFRYTFDYEDRLTYYIMQDMEIRNNFDSELIFLLSKYAWYANIMKYNFSIIKKGYNNQKKYPDGMWYLNALIARAQYSKETLILIKKILKILNKDDEVFIKLEDKGLKTLFNIYYNKV